MRQRIIPTARVNPWCAVPLACACLVSALGNPPEYLDDRFELPPGFHIYRAAGPDLSGGSYALTFDGEGRLLVGDGNAVRRLIDRDHDGVFDSFEVVATGLGWRGPQGLLVYGDRLYAVGGDGIQLFEGYRSGGPLTHRGRIGNKFQTGGDHDAHTILRGHDGNLYFMAGNGAGISNRVHITENSSPVLFEREASVFRISPDGRRWECLAAGGRNPPNLGMNRLGDLFSFDSDMEWHVGLPWYRPVRLNHWAIGGDQGWQEIGAYPPYYVDCLPGILNVGRGSPTWGTFYEHNQFPEKYRDAYFACDYRWKNESNDKYATAGRLVVFFLDRDGAGWKASMETLARLKPDARDAAGRPISFALVDVQVAPDGSLFLSDHNQGIWRIFYAGAQRELPPTPPPIIPDRPPLPLDRKALVEELLALPQPGAEWTRLREEAIRAALGSDLEVQLKRRALDSKESLSKRLRAIRLLAPDFPALPDEFIRSLAKDRSVEIRGQAAWLWGIRGKTGAIPALIGLLNDQDPFVRRRAAEAMTRLDSSAVTPVLIEHLADPIRLVRYVSMAALAHRPTSESFDRAAAKTDPQIRMRALVAGLIRREPVSDASVRRVVNQLLEGFETESKMSPAATPPSRIPPSTVAASRTEPQTAASQLDKESHLDFLRVLALFQKPIEVDSQLTQRITRHLLKHFPDGDRDIRWEQIRLLGDYRCSEGFALLLALLETERDEVTQFHIAQAIARLPGGWTDAGESRLLRWFLGTQHGWFAEFSSKGVEFPDFWATVLTDFGAHHRAALLRDLSAIDFGGQLGGVALDLLADGPNPDKTFISLYHVNETSQAKYKIIRALRRARAPAVANFLRQEYGRTSDSQLRGGLLQSLAAQPPERADLPMFLEGIRHAEPAVVRDCANALARLQPELNETAANLLLSRMAERRELFSPLQKVLATLAGKGPPGFDPGSDPDRRPDEATRNAALAFWHAWYQARFQKKFESMAATGAAEKSDEEIHKFILGEPFKAGNAVRGAKVYETAQCNTCHGGGVTPGREGRIFGPDLAGVTRRLSRPDLAYAIVYPSKQVADRFKAYEVELKDAASFTGFITEQNTDSITLVDREQVRRIPRSQVRSITPQSTSLMPEHVLNRLSWDELRDLLAFLDEGVAPTPDKADQRKPVDSSRK